VISGFVIHPIRGDVCRHTTVRYVITMARTNVACAHVTVISMVRAVSAQNFLIYKTAESKLYWII